MTPLPPSRLGGVLALSAFLLAARTAAADAPAVGVQTVPRRPARVLPGDLPAAVLDQDDPFSAAHLLDSDDGRALLERLKADDPARHDRVFARALELKDLKDLLTGPNDVRALRLGLQNRPACDFCQSPARLLTWTRRWFGAGHDARLKETLYDWANLPAERRAWLEGHGSPEKAWAALEFAARQGRLRAWAAAETEALLKADPRTPGEMGLMSARIDAVAGVLSGDELMPLWQRRNQAQQALASMQEARGRLGSSSDPAIKAKLKAAEQAPDLESRLSALSALFDHAQVAAPALRSQAPPRKDQTFTPATRRAVAELLQTGLMAETAGTWAGADLKAFYAKTPLVVAIAKREGAALAWYWNGVMSINEPSLEEFVKARGRAVADLAKDPALLKELVRELAPIFVHEAIHHQQDVWAMGQGIPSNWSQHQEQEAMMTEALFVLQKSSHDKSYAEFLASHQYSINVREESALARRLEQNGADFFRLSVAATHYPERLSLEGAVWCHIALLHNAIYSDISAEAARRAALAAAERLALETGPRFQASYPTQEDFRDALKRVATPELQRIVTEQRDAVAQQPRIYESYRERLAQATRLTERRLQMLQSGRGASGGGGSPPPPPGGRP